MTSALPSSAEKDVYIQVLGFGLAEGRISQSEYDERVRACEAAGDFAALEKQIDDLPVGAQWAATAWDRAQKKPSAGPIEKPKKSAADAAGRRALRWGSIIAAVGIPLVVLVVFGGLIFTGSSDGDSAEDSPIEVPTGQDAEAKIAQQKVGTDLASVDGLGEHSAAQAVEALEAAGAKEIYAVVFTPGGEQSASRAEGFVTGVGEQKDRRTWVTMSETAAPILDTPDTLEAYGQLTDPIEDIEALKKADVEAYADRAREGMNPRDRIDEVWIFNEENYGDVIGVRVDGQGQKNFLWSLSTGKLLPKSVQLDQNVPR